MDKSESTSIFNPAINDDGDEHQQANPEMKRMFTKKSASYFSSKVLSGNETLNPDDVIANNNVHIKFLDQESSKGTA